MLNNLFPRVGGIGTNMPSSTFGGKVYPDQPFIKSNRGVALIEQCMFVPALGHVPLGTVISFVEAGPRKGQAFPSSGGWAVTAAAAAGATSVTVAEAAAAAFDVGVTLMVYGTDGNIKSTGTITAIGTPQNGNVVITFDSPLLEANPAYVTHSAEGYGICDQSVFSSITGALGSVLLSNAVCYKNRVYGMTDDVKDFLNVMEFGDFYVIR